MTSEHASCRSRPYTTRRRFATQVADEVNRNNLYVFTTSLNIELHYDICQLYWHCYTSTQETWKVLIKG